MRDCFLCLCNHCAKTLINIFLFLLFSLLFFFTTFLFILCSTRFAEVHQQVTSISNIAYSHTTMTKTVIKYRKATESIHFDHSRTLIYPRPHGSFSKFLYRGVIFPNSIFQEKKTELKAFHCIFLTNNVQTNEKN